VHSDLFSLRNTSAIYLPDNIERAVSFQLSEGGVAKQHPVKGGSTDLQAILKCVVSFSLDKNVCVIESHL